MMHIIIMPERRTVEDFEVVEFFFFGIKHLLGHVSGLRIKSPYGSVNHQMSNQKILALGVLLNHKSIIVTTPEDQHGT